MVYLVVISSVPSMMDYADQPGLLTFLVSCVNNGLALLGLPMLACLFGFLVFQRGLDLKFARFIRERFVSLVLPLLAWNVPVLMLLYLLQSRGLNINGYVPINEVYPFEWMSWVNSVFSVTELPLIQPTVFLRDLFVICLLAPLLGIMLRFIPILGLALLVVMSVTNFDGFLFHNNVIPVTFYLGAMAARLEWDVKRFDQYAAQLLGVLLVVCFVFVLFEVSMPFWLAMFAPLIVWPATTLIVNTPTGQWLATLSRAGLFLLLFHGVVLATLNVAYPYLYSGRFEFYVWLTVPVIAAISSQLLFLFLDRFIPGLLTLLLGGRKSSLVKFAG